MGKTQYILSMNKKKFFDLVTKDTKTRRFAKRLVYSRVILTFLLILVQIVLFLLFIIWLNKYLDYFLAGNIILSLLFIGYLSNCKGKNEFKIAWMVPLVVFPLFGIAAYIMYNLNPGGLSLKLKLVAVKNKTLEYQPSAQKTLEVLNEYPYVSDLGIYFLNTGNFPSYKDSSLKYFPNGESFYPDLIEQIDKAEKFIFLEFFIIGIDESWNKILDLLAKKVRQGVEVRLLYDAVGSIMVASKTYQNYLAELGIKSHIFIPLIPFFSTRLNNRDHRKIIIIDGNIAYTGGLNLSDEYFNHGKNRFEYWKDNAVKIQGPAVRTFTSMFLQNWNLESGEKEDYEKYLRIDYKKQTEPGLIIPYGDDAYNKYDIAEETYLYILGKSQKYVYITTPYILLDNQMLSNLIFAARRGVDVKIVVPNVADHFITFCIGRIFLKDLMDAGVEVYLYNKGFIHAKTFISDDRIATVGSVNLDYRSFYHHFECGVVAYQSSEIFEIKRDYEELIENSTRLTTELYKKIPLYQKFFGYLFKIFAPLM